MAWARSRRRCGAEAQQERSPLSHSVSLSSPAQSPLNGLAKASSRIALHRILYRHRYPCVRPASRPSLARSLRARLSHLRPHAHVPVHPAARQSRLPLPLHLNCQALLARRSPSAPLARLWIASVPAARAASRPSQRAGLLVHGPALGEALVSTHCTSAYERMDRLACAFARAGRSPRGSFSPRAKTATGDRAQQATSRGGQGGGAPRHICLDGCGSTGVPEGCQARPERV